MFDEESVGSESEQQRPPSRSVSLDDASSLFIDFDDKTSPNDRPLGSLFWGGVGSSVVVGGDGGVAAPGLGGGSAAKVDAIRAGIHSSSSGELEAYPFPAPSAKAWVPRVVEAQPSASSAAAVAAAAAPASLDVAASSSSSAKLSRRKASSSSSSSSTRQRRGGRAAKDVNRLGARGRPVTIPVAAWSAGTLDLFTGAPVIRGRSALHLAVAIPKQLLQTDIWSIIDQDQPHKGDFIGPRTIAVAPSSWSEGELICRWPSLDLEMRLCGFWGGPTSRSGVRRAPMDKIRSELACVEVRRSLRAFVAASLVDGGGHDRIEMRFALKIRHAGLWKLKCVLSRERGEGERCDSFAPVSCAAACCVSRSPPLSSPPPPPSSRTLTRLQVRNISATASTTPRTCVVALPNLFRPGSVKRKRDPAELAAIAKRKAEKTKKAKTTGGAAFSSEGGTMAPTNLVVHSSSSWSMMTTAMPLTAVSFSNPNPLEASLDASLFDPDADADGVTGFPEIAADASATLRPTRVPESVQEAMLKALPPPQASSAGHASSVVGHHEHAHLKKKPVLSM